MLNCVQWTAHRPTPNCHIYLIDIQLGILQFVTHWGRLMCCPLYLLYYHTIFLVSALYHAISQITLAEENYTKKGVERYGGDLCLAVGQNRLEKKTTY